MQLSPAQLFFGRQIKTRLPIVDALLHRNKLDENVVQDKFEEKREKQKYYYDRNAKALPELNIGDQVIFKKNSKEWYYGTVKENVNGRSYIVRDNFNNYFRRNRRFISKAKNNGFNVDEMPFENEFLSNVFNRSENVREFENVQPNSASGQTHDIINESVNNFECPPVPQDCVDAPEIQKTVQDNRPIEIQLESNNKEQIVTTKSGGIVKPPNRYGWD